MAKFHVTHCYFDFIKQTEKKLPHSQANSHIHINAHTVSQFSILIRDGKRERTKNVCDDGVEGNFTNVSVNPYPRHKRHSAFKWPHQKIAYTYALCFSKEIKKNNNI